MKREIWTLVHSGSSSCLNNSLADPYFKPYRTYYGASRILGVPSYHVGGYLWFRYCILSSILTRSVNWEGLRLEGSTYSSFWLSIVPGNIMPWARSNFNEYNL